MTGTAADTPARVPDKPFARSESPRVEPPRLNTPAPLCFPWAPGATDAATGQMVLFGYNCTSYLSDTWVWSALTATGVRPNAGPPAGGTSVTFTGSNLAGSGVVSFGDGPAAFTVVSDAELSAVPPPSLAGTVDVIVTSSSGTSATVAADKFSFESAPAVSSVSPGNGLPAGGSTVQITGSDFEGADEVSFGNLGAASFSVTSATEITAVSTAEVAGAVDVTRRARARRRPRTCSATSRYRSSARSARARGHRRAGPR